MYTTKNSFFIIPAYNEAATLAEIIRRVWATGLVHEIIVVDDGSSDDLLAILTRLENAGHPHCGSICCLYSRSWGEGKKIQWQDGLIAIWMLVKYRFFAGKE